MSVDQREAINVTHHGAVGDGVTDDTAAFQAALDRYGFTPQKSGAIVVPVGNYKITNTLFAEGNASHGLRLKGAMGRSRGATGASLIWFGHPGAGMFHFLGLNALTMEHLDIRCDSGTKMKWGVLLDTTVTYTATVTVNTTSLTRTSNIVTVVTATVHGMVAGDTVRIAGASNAAFNGTFLVLTVPSTTTLTYIQTAANTSTTGGTTSKYKSGGSSGSSFRDVTIRDTSSTAINVSSISRDGSGTGTVALASAHYARPGDKILIAGVSNATFNEYYTVSGITDATTLTYVDSQGSASSSGGTVLPDNYAMAFAHRDTLSMQVSEVTLNDVVLIGNFSTSRAGLHFLAAGNTKNFAIWRGSTNGFHFGVDWGASSGTFLIHGLIIGSNSSHDFYLGTGAMTLVGVESESVGGRFVGGATGGNAGHLDMIGCSVQMTLAADDVMIQYSGTVQLIGNTLKNWRTEATYPKIYLGGPDYDSTDLSSLVSLGNWYQGAPTGFIPVYDGQGNQVLTGAGYYANRAVSVVSMNDGGGFAGDLYKLSNVVPMAAIVSQQAGTTYVPGSGFQRWASADVAKIANNAGNADLNLLSKDSSDVVQVGDAGGMTLVGPLTMADAKNIVVNATTGTKIGTATTQKLSLWNATPITQPAGIADADGTLADITTKFNSLVAKLEAVGLLATV